MEEPKKEKKTKKSTKEETKKKKKKTSKEGGDEGGKKKTKKVKSEEGGKKKTKKSKKTAEAEPAKKEAAKDAGENKHVEAAKNWIKSNKNKQHIKFVKHLADKHKIRFKIGDEELPFDVNYPLTEEDVWSVESEEIEESWGLKASEGAMSATTIGEVLKIAADAFDQLSDEEFSDGDDDDYGSEGDDLDAAFESVDAKPQKSGPPPIDTSMFLIPAGYEAGAIQAIAQQLQTIMKTPKEEREFDAGPIDNNITHWEVKLWGIPKDDDLYKDMKKMKVEHITLHVVFPTDFPFSAPFIRVIRPRFAFRTGHVTVGGAICTFLLSNEGWNPMYRLPQVMVDIRAMFTAGKGRLDKSNTSDYTEWEAMDAFRRLLATHGWTHWKTKQ